MPLVDVNDVSRYYEIHAKGPTVVLPHGITQV